MSMYAFASGVWDDAYCTNTVPYLCASALHRAKSSAVMLAAGEARPLELPHVHNPAVNGGYLGLAPEHARLAQLSAFSGCFRMEHIAAGFDMSAFTHAT